MKKNLEPMYWRDPFQIYGDAEHWMDKDFGWLFDNRNYILDSWKAVGFIADTPCALRLNYTQMHIQICVSKVQQNFYAEQVYETIKRRLNTYEANLHQITADIKHREGSTTTLIQFFKEVQS